jgi:hypothetical protein
MISFLSFDKKTDCFKKNNRYNEIGLNILFIKDKICIILTNRSVTFKRWLKGDSQLSKLTIIKYLNLLGM